jgi:hypothetical protein
MRGIRKVLSAISLWVKATSKPEKSFHSVHHQDRRKDLIRLMGDISRELRIVSGPARSSSLLKIRERHEELGRLLSELQRRLRRLDEANQRKYEQKAVAIMADAAKLGITLPPI